MSRRSCFAGVGGGSPGGRGFRPGRSFLVPTSRTQPPAFMCFLIEVVLVPRAMAMRASDQSPWTTSCLMASQSGSAFCVSSEICGASSSFPSPLVGEGGLRKHRLREPGEGENRTSLLSAWQAPRRKARR